MDQKTPTELDTEVYRRVSTLQEERRQQMYPFAQMSKASGKNSTPEPGYFATKPARLLLKFIRWLAR